MGVIPAPAPAVSASKYRRSSPEQSRRKKFKDTRGRPRALELPTARKPSPVRPAASVTNHTRPKTTTNRQPKQAPSPPVVPLSHRPGPRLIKPQPARSTIPQPTPAHTPASDQATGKGEALLQGGRDLVIDSSLAVGGVVVVVVVGRDAAAAASLTCCRPRVRAPGYAAA